MASATISSSSSSYSPFETNSNNVRDDSFSSYLALIRQSLSTELANPGSRLSSFQTIVAPPRKQTAMGNNDDLDVFGAEKYFSGSLDVQDYPELLTSEDFKSSWSSSSKSTKKMKQAAKSQTRSSTCSETSANSHSILLGRTILQNHQQQQTAAASSRCRSFLDVFRCYCSKKNLVQDEADNSTSSRSSGKINNYLPPTTPAVVLQSESSSDLFEIESVSMSSRPVVYEPSEASIEWSVATASAANFSVASSAWASEGVKVRRRRSSSGMLTFGCASGEAVSVTPDKVGALERYHVMMDLAGPAGPVGPVAAAIARMRRA